MKLSPNDQATAKTLFENGHKIKEIAEIFHVSYNCIYCIVTPNARKKASEASKRSRAKRAGKKVAPKVAPKVEPKNVEVPTYKTRRMNASEAAILFAKLVDASKAKNETNDCAVKAVAAACDVSYDDAHHALEVAGRVRRKGTYFHQTVFALRCFGFTYETQLVNCRTISQVPRHYNEEGAVYLVRTRNHILAVVDGEVCDWTKGRRHEVKQVVKVVPMSGTMAKFYNMKNNK